MSSMSKHRHILRSYRRTHRGTHCQEGEEAKIAREVAEVGRLQRRQERVLRRLVSEMEAASERLLDEQSAIAHRARKTSGNARTHRSRLTELRKNDEFE